MIAQRLLSADRSYQKTLQSFYLVNNFSLLILKWANGELLKQGTSKLAELCPLKAPQVQGSPPPHWGVYVTVDNVDECTKLAESLGAKILVRPTNIPDVGRFAYFVVIIFRQVY